MSTPPIEILTCEAGTNTYPAGETDTTKQHALTAIRLALIQVQEHLMPVEEFKKKYLDKMSAEKRKTFLEEYEKDRSADAYVGPDGAPNPTRKLDPNKWYEFSKLPVKTPFAVDRHIVSWLLTGKVQPEELCAVAEEVGAATSLPKFKALVMPGAIIEKYAKQLAELHPLKFKKSALVGVGDKLPSVPATLSATELATVNKRNEKVWRGVLGSDGTPLLLTPQEYAYLLIVLDSVGVVKPWELLRPAEVAVPAGETLAKGTPGSSSYPTTVSAMLNELAIGTWRPYYLNVGRMRKEDADILKGQLGTLVGQGGGGLQEEINEERVLALQGAFSILSSFMSGGTANSIAQAVNLVVEGWSEEDRTRYETVRDTISELIKSAPEGATKDQQYTPVNENIPKELLAYILVGLEKKQVTTTNALYLNLNAGTANGTAFQGSAPLIAKKDKQLLAELGILVSQVQAKLIANQQLGNSDPWLTLARIIGAFDTAVAQINQKEQFDQSLAAQAAASDKALKAQADLSKEALAAQAEATRKQIEEGSWQNIKGIIIMVFASGVSGWLIAKRQMNLQVQQFQQSMEMQLRALGFTEESIALMRDANAANMDVIKDASPEQAWGKYMTDLIAKAEAGGFSPIDFDAVLPVIIQLVEGPLAGLSPRLEAGPGVGKTAARQGLVLATMYAYQQLEAWETGATDVPEFVTLPEELRALALERAYLNMRDYEMDTEAVAGKAGTVGQGGKTLGALVKASGAKHAGGEIPVWHIGEEHRLYDAGKSSSSNVGIIDTLLDPMSKGELVIISDSTPADMRKVSHPAYDSRKTVVNMEDDPDGIERALEASGRYLGSREAVYGKKKVVQAGGEVKDGAATVVKRPFTAQIEGRGTLIVDLAIQPQTHAAIGRYVRHHRRILPDGQIEGSKRTATNLLKQVIAWKRLKGKRALDPFKAGGIEFNGTNYGTGFEAWKAARAAANTQLETEGVTQADVREFLGEKGLDRVPPTILPKSSARRVERTGLEAFYQEEVDPAAVRGALETVDGGLVDLWDRSTDVEVIRTVQDVVRAVGADVAMDAARALAEQGSAETEGARVLFAIVCADAKNEGNVVDLTDWQAKSTRFAEALVEQRRAAVGGARGGWPARRPGAPEGLHDRPEDARSPILDPSGRSFK